MTEEQRKKELIELFDKYKCEACGKSIGPVGAWASNVCDTCVRRRHRIAVGRGSKHDYEVERRSKMVMV